jgi:hypothetical protein
MTQEDTAAVVRRSIIVEAPIEDAFSVFTGRFGDFKPKEHNMRDLIGSAPRGGSAAG